MIKILIGGPIFQKPDILKEYLDSLDRLHQDGLALSYLFVDDNTDEISKDMLQTFQKEHKEVHLIEGTKLNDYQKDETTHYWNWNLMYKVGEFKNQIIRYALEKEFDYLFLVDSDLVLNPRLLLHLISCKKDIVCETYWTKWTPASIPEPNVWLYDQYNYARCRPDESLSPQEVFMRKMEFLTMLRVPGLYPVGGLGACTLISRKALEKGVHFGPIGNLRYIRGEDRFFCIRATAIGLELYTDTHYPPYHIYREADLSGVAEFITENQ